MRPLILILSANAWSRWPWLRDIDIDPQNIFTRSAGRGLHQKWSGARIVRIREENAPAVILDKLLQLAKSSETDTRRRNELLATQEIHVPTSPNNKLFRVDNASIPMYLSIGGKAVHRRKRGLSCYRQHTVLDSRQAVRQSSASDLSIYPLHTFEPVIGHWPTPNAVEYTMGFLQEGDDPDLVAAFVDSLRYGFEHYGDWTSLPAPLFFIRVVKDYLAEFTEEEQVAEVPDEDDSMTFAEDDDRTDEDDEENWL